MLTIIGSINIDIIANTLATYRAQDSNPAKVHISVGGVAMNYAHNLRLLGEKLQFITAFSDDTFGKMALQECAHSKIDTVHSCIITNSRANIFMGIHNDKGDLEAAACDAELVEKYINPSFLAQQIHIINASNVVMADTNLSVESLAYLFDNCCVPLMIDGVSTTKTERLIQALSISNHPHIHTLKLNKLEYAIFIEHTKQINMSSIIDNILVSKGKEGVSIYTFIDSPVHQTFPALQANKIVSTLGAGDAFLSGWAYATLHQYPLDRAIKLAQQLAVHTLAVPESVNPSPYPSNFALYL